MSTATLALQDMTEGFPGAHDASGVLAFPHSGTSSVTSGCRAVPGWPAKDGTVCSAGSPSCPVSCHLAELFGLL